MSNHLKSLTFLHEKFPTNGRYPFSLPVFNKTNTLTFDTPVTFFIGENGTGKSTLLEAVSRASGIYIWGKTDEICYHENPFEKQLHKYISLEWTKGRIPGAFFGSEVFRDFTKILDAWASSDPDQLKFFGGESLVTKSHGQSIMAYFRARYKIKGLYLMDEPETALSPRSQIELLKIIVNNCRAGHAQFIIATHSPILLACEGSRIYNFDHVPIEKIEYEKTDHYQIYKGFLTDRQKYL